MMEQDEKGNVRIRATKRKVRSPLSQEELDDPEMRRPAAIHYSPPGQRVEDGASCSHQPMYQNLPDDRKPGGSVTSVASSKFAGLNEYYLFEKEQERDPAQSVVQCPYCGRWIATGMAFLSIYCVFNDIGD